ncbi:MAG TPA: PilZ domain-containing protein [Candidatus Sulfotelmatobacter sp.]|nr:PilZ domain-containing protein [Candidatus Sulfotelmatobacter sp.]
MNAGTSAARQARGKYRHELRTLTYVTLDQANGGIIRNLSGDGVGVQAVAAVRSGQEVRVRFELRYPKLRVEARAQVMWSNSSGQCGARFLDLSPTLRRQMQEWIFGNLLQGASLHADRGMFATPLLHPGRDVPAACVEEDGLMVSSTPVKVIDFPEISGPGSHNAPGHLLSETQAAPLEWLLQPLSGQGLSWTVNILAVLAGLLLFALVFLSITQESPSWTVALAGAAVVPLMYWGFFQLFGGCSLGERMARLAANEDGDEEPADARFR